MTGRFRLPVGGVGIGFASRAALMDSAHHAGVE